MLDETGEAIDARASVVACAKTELGERDPDKYWHIVQPLLVGNRHTISWCGGFALWTLVVTELCAWKWTIYKGGNSPSGFLYRLKRTTDPHPGDMAYFHKGQHHAIVGERDGDDLLTIDGNSMRFPKEGVTQNERKLSEVTAFYSIVTLIS